MSSGWERMETAQDVSDAALVAAARTGDKEAYAVLLARHRRMVLALCTRTLGDLLLAEDAVQEAALNAMLSLDRLRQPESFGSWLAGIGLNVCRRWLRSHTWQDWSLDALYGGVYRAGPCDERNDPTLLAEEAELAGRVRHAVAELPHGQRSAVLLFYLSGLTYAETAAVLGIEVSAVKTRLHKARRTLRRQLWEVWQEEGMAIDEATQPVDVQVTDVRRVPGPDGGPARHVAVLEDVSGSRQLAIWIGRAEGESLALHLEKVDTARPLTYALMAGIIGALEGRLREVRVNRLADDVFYAAAEVEGPGGVKSVDARPSDAIILALALGAPIRVHEGVFRAVAAGERAAELTGEGTQGAADIVAERLAAERCK